MWPLHTVNFPVLTQVNLLRYLIVWRVNGSQVQLPRCLPVEISQVLASLIAERLPSQQAKPWRKAVAGWETLPDEAGQVGAGQAGAGQVGAGLRPAPTIWPGWPIEAVVWPYPGKRAYGQGEPLLWELKLLGAAADHGLFLEMILPAMEAAATTTDERWRRARSLWGRFDIQAIYAARGPRWEPFVTDGRLDLAYRPTPSQWAEGFTFEADGKRRYHRLSWLTPFDFGLGNADFGMDGGAVDFGLGNADFGMDGGADNPQSPIPNPQSPMPEKPGRAVRNPQSTVRKPQSTVRKPQSKAPALRAVLDALMARIAPLTLGKWATAEQAWGTLTAQEQQSIWLDCEACRLKRAMLERAPRDGPGRWIGAQLFAALPPRLWPYLELASVLHVGKHTHFGCGTFALE
jgi:hypothetical protein